MLELFTPEFIEKLSPETLRGLGVSGLEEEDGLSGGSDERPSEARQP